MAAKGTEMCGWEGNRDVWLVGDGDLWLERGRGCVAGKGTGMCGWEGVGDVWLGRGRGCVTGKGTGMCG